MKINVPTWILIRIIVYSFIVFLIFLWKFSNVLIKPYRLKTNVTPLQFNIPFEKVRIKSKDGLDLAGWWITNKLTNSAIILCHGVGADKSDMVNFIPFLYKNGYNLLLFDFRGHGENKSKYGSLGYFEVNDLLGAINFVKSKNIKNIGVIGLSLGASTSIMTAVKTKDIKAIIADSGFARLEPLISHYAKKFYHISFSPIIFIVQWIAEIRIGARFSEVNPIEDIKKLDIPIFIIHGANDENIPVENAKLLYNAAQEPKKLFIVPNAYHVESRCTDQKRYESEVLKFFNKHLKRRR